MSCAKGSCQESLATTYGSPNDHYGAATLDICEKGFGSAVRSCASTYSSTGVYDCPSLSSSSASYVQVHMVSTGSGLPLSFGPGPRRIAACARATAGYASSADSMAATISGCEWNSYTSGGTVFGPPERVLIMQSGSSKYTSPCATDPAYK